MNAAEITIDSLLAANAFPATTFRIEFNPDKHVLGALCRRGHAFADTGKTVRGAKHRDCMICLRLNAFVWHRKYPERSEVTRKNCEDRPGRLEARRESRKRWNARGLNWLKQLVWGAQKRATKKGMPCDIDAQFMLDLWHEQNGRCHWLGVEMTLAGSARHPLKPSIDRLDSAKGYTRDNVAWASNFANRAKGEATTEEFADVLRVIGFRK